MTFNGNIPLATDLISNSQNDLLANNQFLAETAGNLASNGFYRLPNGLLMQWSSETGISSGGHTRSFPIAYTTAYWVHVMPIASSSTDNAVLDITFGGGLGFTNTQYRFRVSSSGMARS